MPLKLLLDLDPGIDDALALDHALHEPGFELLAVTTTFGCLPVAQATRNALLLCALAGRPDLPVCSGVASPLRKAVMHHDPARHGHDGLGDCPERPTGQHGPDERSAARCIVELARAHPGELCVVLGGPVDNLVQALRLEPHLPELLQQVVVAGGSIAAPGDASPVAEFNFWQDPYAADQLLTAGLRLTLVGLDVSQAVPLDLPLVEARLARRPEPMRQLLRHAARHLAQYQASLEPGTAAACPVPTLLALAYLQYPSLFRVETGRIRVVPEGLAEGQSIMDRRAHIPYPQAGWEDSLPTVQAVLAVDQATLLARLRPVAKG